MRPRLFLLAPTIVFRAQVNQAAFTFPIAELTYDSVTIGSYSDILPGMTMVVGGAAGLVNGGRQRIRKIADATKVYFGRSSQGFHDGEVNPQDDGYIEVWNDYRVWAKIPVMPIVDETVTTFKDHELPVGSRTTTPPPIANAGVGFAGTIDSTTGKITVALSGANSVAVADGATITGYSWDIEDGTVTVGNTSSASLTVTFPAGFRWVSLTVTDSNTNIHTARIPIYARNPASDTSISAFNITQHRITPDGQEFSVTVYSDILAEYPGGSTPFYPDGTLVMVWDDDVVSSSTTRPGLMFLGWHHEDPASIRADRLGLERRTVLTCVDVAGKLRALPGFPQVVNTDAIRDTDTHASITWEYMVDPTMKKYIHYLLHWHSTALDLTDFWFKGSTAAVDYPFLVLESGSNDLWRQVSERLRQMTPDHILTCNRKGQLAVWPDPMLLDEADRTEAFQGRIETSNWKSVRYTHKRTPSTHWLRGGAIVAQDTPAYTLEGELDIPTVFCIAPGLAPGQGQAVQEDYERLALSQADLNRTIGHKYARLNAPESEFSVELVGSDDFGLEPADIEWVWLQLGPEQQAQRGLRLETMEGIILVYEERGLVQEIGIQYNPERFGLSRTISLTWERECYGTPAVTI